MKTPLTAIAAIALAGCATATSQAATSATRTTTVAAVTGSVTGPTRIIVWSDGTPFQAQLLMIEGTGHLS